MQNEITTKSNLLDKDGNLLQKGWGRSALLQYHRNQVSAMKFKIKEWDYYAVLNDKFGIALTVADNGYFGTGVITVFDFTIPKNGLNKFLCRFPWGNLRCRKAQKPGR